MEEIILKDGARCGVVIWDAEEPLGAIDLQVVCDMVRRHGESIFFTDIDSGGEQFWIAISNRPLTLEEAAQFYDLYYEQQDE